ncbi:MAG: hypothetical protein WBQ72_15080 [Terriglobales bacterium]
MAISCERSGPMEHAMWDKLMRGLSTRNYGAVGRSINSCNFSRLLAMNDSQGYDHLPVAERRAKSRRA